MSDVGTFNVQPERLTGKGCRAIAGVAREGAAFDPQSDHSIIPRKGDGSVTGQWNPQRVASTGLPCSRCTRPQEVQKQEQQKVLEQARPKATFRVGCFEFPMFTSIQFTRANKKKTKKQVHMVNWMELNPHLPCAAGFPKNPGFEGFQAG